MVGALTDGRTLKISEGKTWLRGIKSINRLTGVWATLVLHSTVYPHYCEHFRLCRVDSVFIKILNALTGSPHRKTKTRNLQIRTGTSSNLIFFAPATKTERILLKYPVNKRMLVIQTGKFEPCIYHVAETLFLSTIYSTLIHHGTLYLIQSSYVLKKCEPKGYAVSDTHWQLQSNHNMPGADAPCNK